MHPRNKLMLLAGIQIDPSIERMSEARTIPAKKSELKPKNEKNIAKQKQCLKKAIGHCTNAIKSLESIPAVDFSGDVPHCISEIEEIIGANDSGLKALLQKIEDSTVSESINENEEMNFDVNLASDELATTDNATIPPASDNEDTEDDYKEGDRVFFDNGIWIIHIADPKADMVGIISACMRDSSKSEKDKAMQQVKRDKLRTPSKEEIAVMAGPDGIIGTSDDVRVDLSTGEEVTESTLNFKASNEQSFENDDFTPTNVVKQDDASWANSLKQEVIDNQYTNNLDKRGEQSMTDYEDKVVVPEKIKSAIKASVKKFKAEAEKTPAGHTGSETRQLYLDTAAAFQKISDHLDNGTVQDIKLAQTFATSLMGPILQQLPLSVWDFLSHGGRKRSLKDYMNPITKFPVTGPSDS